MQKSGQIVKISASARKSNPLKSKDLDGKLELEKIEKSLTRRRKKGEKNRKGSQNSNPDRNLIGLGSESTIDSKTIPIKMTLKKTGMTFEEAGSIKGVANIGLKAPAWQ